MWLIDKDMFNLQMTGKTNSIINLVYMPRLSIAQFFIRVRLK